MNFEITPLRRDDGSVDAGYTFGRPVATYLSVFQHMQLLLLRARLEARRRGQPWPLARAAADHS
jgi:hypothetical protein